MTQFYYKAMNQQGAIITGQLEAQSKEDVGLNLSKKRLTLLSLQQGKEKKQKSRSINLHVPKKSVLSFTRELLALTRAGLSLVKSLELLIEQTTNENLQSILVNTCEKVKEGKSFSEVLQRYPRVFSELYVNTVYIGEISGTLDQILESLIEHLENENQLRSDLKKAFRYPMFVVGSLIAAFILFITFVIPRFEPIFSKSQTELPIPTKIILLISEMFTSYGFVLLGLFLILGLAFWLLYKTENGKYLIHSFLIKLPIYGSLLKKIAFYRFASTLSLLNRNGIPLVKAMNTSVKVESNKVYKKEIEYLQQHVEKGEKIATVMKRNGLFSKVMIHMVSIGEITGSMDEMLDKAATYISSEIKDSIERITSMIEPMVTVILASMVLLLALSIFLPMWNMLGIH